jgi:hypothetical protein
LRRGRGQFAALRGERLGRIRDRRFDRQEIGPSSTTGVPRLPVRG